MATYATVDDLKEYTDLDTGVADPVLEAALDRAERDVDRILRLRGTRVDATGLKLDPADLDEHTAAALSRATCAQAEYRLAMGEEFFIRAQHSSVRGPDFSMSGQLPYIGPKVRLELAGMGLDSGRVVSATLITPYSYEGGCDNDLPWPVGSG